MGGVEPGQACCGEPEGECSGPGAAQATSGDERGRFSGEPEDDESHETTDDADQCPMMMLYGDVEASKGVLDSR